MYQKIRRRTTDLFEEGVFDCPRCGIPVDLIGHKADWKPRDKQKFYYKKWYSCPNSACMWIQMDVKYRVNLVLSLPEDRLGREGSVRSPHPAQSQAGHSRGRITKRAIREYGYRNRNLEELGFDSYDDYLKSHLWKSIFHKVLSISSDCYGCYSIATEVHHGSYDIPTLRGDHIESVVGVLLFPICRKCHKSIEYTRKGNKVDPLTATRKLQAKRARAETRARARARASASADGTSMEPTDLALLPRLAG